MAQLVSNLILLYTMESGAEKKRKKKKEQEYWNSLNGPVIIESSDE